MDITESVAIGLTDLLAHRGPDDRGLAMGANFVMGHRRLSIIDTSAQGHQPFTTPDQRYILVYNGEIYNYQQLRKQLELQGSIFHTHSDTEVLLQAYIAYGEKCLEYLDGMFAFAIYDKVANQLFIARDNFGKKPLYYQIVNGKFIFASETSVLLKVVDKEPAINYEGLNQFLSLGYVMAPLTLYDGIMQLEMGCCATINFNNDNPVIRIHRYWDYADEFQNITLGTTADWQANIRDLFEKAVKKRLVSDVEIGLLLSGGFDSNLTGWYAGKHIQNFKSFSVAFDVKAYDESAQINQSIKLLNTLGNVLQLGQLSPVDILGIVQQMDHALADNSYIPYLKVCELASKQVKVVLTGDGADEIFAGYPTYQADKARKIAKILFGDLLNKVGTLNGKNDGVGFRTKLSRFARMYHHDYRKAHYGWRLLYSPDEIVALLGDQYRELIMDSDPYRIFEKAYDKVEFTDEINQHLYVDGVTWLTNDVLVKVDRASMRNGLEVRCPFLDKDLVSYVAGIPGGKKMDILHPKSLLKRSFSGSVPNTIAQRKKRGFNAPMGSWMQAKGNDEFKQYAQLIFETKVKRYL